MFSMVNLPLLTIVILYSYSFLFERRINYKLSLKGSYLNDVYERSYTDSCVDHVLLINLTYDHICLVINVFRITDRNAKMDINP